jgi:sugar lactone lactonase YvrE
MSSANAAAGTLKGLTRISSASFAAGGGLASTFLRGLLLASGILAVGAAQGAHAQITFTGAPVVLGSGFNTPFGIAVDAAGDLFVADNGNMALKEIVAVNGAIPANATILTLSSGFGSITGVAVDAAGDVFVIDATLEVVEELVAVNGSIPANPTIRSLGSGFNLPVGVALDAAGDVFVADQGDNQVKEIVAVNGSIPANPTILVLGTGFELPQGVAVDTAGDVFVADEGDNKIKEIPASCISGANDASCVLTLGSGFNGPTQVVVDAAGDLFLADQGNNAVKEIVAVNGSIPANPTILTLGGGFNYPSGVALAPDGDVYVGDSNNNEVKEIELRAVSFGGINVCPPGQTTPAPCAETLTLNYNVTANSTLGVTTNVTTAGAQRLDFSLSSTTCVGAVTTASCSVNVTFAPIYAGLRTGAVHILDANNNVLATTLVSGTGLAPKFAVLPGTLVAFPPSPPVQSVYGIADSFDGQGLYYSDSISGNVYYNPGSGFFTTLPLTGVATPGQLAIDGSGAVYILDGATQIVKVDTSFNQTTAFSTANSSPFGLASITGFAVDAQGDIFMVGPGADTGGLVVELDPSGNFTLLDNLFTANFTAMALGPNGSVYAISYDANAGVSTLYAITTAGQQTTVASNLPAGITSIVVDPGGTIYLPENSLVAPYTAGGLLAIDASNVQTSYPIAGLDIARQAILDPAGDLFIANTSGQQNDAPSGNVLIIARSEETLNLGSVAVGSTSAPQGLTVFNVGNQPLTFADLTFPTGFGEDASPSSVPAECAASLGAGASCLYTAVFTPTATGPAQGSASVTTNDLNAAGTVESITLEGTGTAAGGGAPVSMTLTGPANPPVYGGAPGVYTVTEVDATGTPVTGDNDTVNFTVTGPEQLNSLSTTLVNGVGTLNLTLNDPGTYTMVATDPTNGLTATDSDFAIASTGGSGTNVATVGLALSPAAPYYFDNAILTVTVTGQSTPPPTGTITYAVDGGATITVDLSSPVSGPTTVSFQLGQLAIGSHSVSVTYSGGGANDFYAQSSPEVLNFTVTDPPLSLVSSEQLDAFANAGTPDGVAVDSAGDVFLADTAGGQVLEYTPAGTRSVVPFSGLVAPNGVAVDSYGNIYVSDSAANQVYEYGARIGQLTLSFEGLTPGTLNDPGKVALGETGSVYVADTGNNRVLVLGSDSIPSVVAAAGLSSPKGVAVDAAGNIYIADSGNNRVVKIDANQNQTTVLSTTAPLAVTVDASGNVYVLNSENAVTRIDAQGHQVPLSGVGYLNGYDISSLDIAADAAGHLLLPGNAPVTPGNQTGAEVLVISTNAGIQVQDATVNGAAAMGVGNYLVPSSYGASPSYSATDLAANSEFTASQNLNCSTSLAASGICSYGITFNPVLPGVRSGSFTLSNANGVALRTDAVYGNGLAPLLSSGTAGEIDLNAAGLALPVAVAVDSLGNAYVADAGNGTIFKVGIDESAPVPLLTGLTSPSGVAVDGIGNVYAIDSAGNSIQKIDPLGNVSTLTSALTDPQALAVDGGGNLYVGAGGFDGSGPGQVLRVDPLGNLRTLLGNLPTVPAGIAVDGQGNVYASTGPGTITEISPSSVASTITVGFTPGYLAVEASGVLTVVATDQSEIYRVDQAGNQRSIRSVPGISGVALAGNGGIYFTTTITPGVDYISESALNYAYTGTIPLGQASYVGFYSIFNSGNQPLIFTGFAITPPLQQQTGTTCSAATTLAAGAECDIFSDFVPTVVGLSTGTMSLTDNTLNVPGTTQTITVSGTGIALSLAFSAGPPAYLYSGAAVGSVAVTEANAVTASNITLTVTGPDGYSQVYGPTATTAGTVSFSVNPLAVPGIYTYTATSSDGATEAVATETVVPQSVQAPGQPVGTPATAQTVTLVFGSQSTLAATNAVQVVTQGVPNLDFALATAQGADVCVAGATYAAGQSCTEAVVFAPTAPGLRLGAVVLSGTSQDNMYGNVAATAFLSGVGEGPLLDFNTVAAPTTLVGYPTVSAPEGIAVDAAGNVFVADSANQVVLKIPAGGGGPVQLDFGEELTFPVAVALDGAGDVYVVDQEDGGSSVFELPAGGILATSVYNSEDTLSGIAVDGAGNVYVSDQSANTIVEIPPGGISATLVAPAAGLNTPQGLAIDAAGDLFIADAGNDRVAELAAGATTLTPVATGLANVPNAVALDPAGNLYIAESQGNAVVETNAAGVVQLTLNGGNTGITVPLGVALDGLGNLYVASPNNQAAVEFPRSVSSAVAFGTQAAGTVGTIVLQGLTNDGNQALAFTSLAASADFVVDAAYTTCSTTTTLAVAANCTLGVDFAPPANTAAGTVLNGSVIVADNAPNAPQTITLSGTAGASLLSAQTITLAPVANQAYGAAPFAVTAASTSGLPVTVGVQSGPATIANGVVTITGVGTVVLVATQPGNASYSAATVTTSFVVAPATLTVTATSLSSVYGQALPTLTDSIAGFVYSDTAASAVTGAAALTTAATSASAPGSYPITAALGTLAAANYTFAFVPGTLTITQAAQTIAFAPIGTQSYGASFTPTATASSGQPVTISVQSGPATAANNLVTVNGVGTVVLAANQAGNADYSAAPTATTSFAVVPAATSVALSAPATVRTPNTVSLSATVSSPATGETGTVTFLDGTTVLGQSALGASDTASLSGVALAVGTHSITASYSGAADFSASTSTAATVVVEPPAVTLNAIAPTAVAVGSSDTTINATGANFSSSSIVDFNGTPLATTFVGATQLTAVVPAAQLATAGNANVTVADAVSASTSLPQSFAILPVTSVTFTGPPSSPPGQQPTLIFQLQQAYAISLSGTMTMTFTPDPGNPDDPAVQFATGGRTFNFTLPPNTTETPLILVQAGTTSGTISVSLQLTASGVNVTPPNLAPITIVVPKVAPTISALSFSASGNTLTVVVSGYSSTREIQSATFSFTPGSGATLADKSLTVTANTLFATWYAAADSAQYGSSFTYTQLFTLSGPASAVGGVGATLTNSIGTSEEVTSP